MLQNGSDCTLLQGTTDLPIKPINRPILQDLPIIGITDPINLYIGSVSDQPIMGAIIVQSFVESKISHWYLDAEKYNFFPLERK